MYSTGFGFEAIIVEMYVLLCAVSQVLGDLMRIWGFSINYTVASGKSKVKRWFPASPSANTFP